MRTLAALLVLGIVVLSACAGQPQVLAPKELLSCKCDAGVVKVSENAKEATYKCDDAFCPGAVGFECWQRTCNFVSIDNSTGDVKRFDGKCCAEPLGDGVKPSPGLGPLQPPAGGECSSDSDCVPSTCCHPSACVTKEKAPDCSGLACSMDCAPGTLDCGQGNCACKSGECKAEISAV